MTYSGPWPDGVRFVRTELQTGQTFARIALTARWPEKVARNRGNARKAYDVALAYIPAIALTPELSAELQELIRELHDSLVRLGEAV
jgi:hypothetical protein